MNNYAIAASLLITIIAGTLIARSLQYRRQRKQLTERLEPFAPKAKSLNTITTRLSLNAKENSLLGFDRLNLSIDMLIAQAGADTNSQSFLFSSSILFLLPIAAASLLQLDLLSGAVIGCLLGAAPFARLKFKQAQLRKKFVTQLPDAIDLMVSVLRTGHSIPQAVKTVSEELPAPLGNEFAQVLQRMNLGQPLSQALMYSCEKFRSFELDLIRRAATIQGETGGSLAELLEKTNHTLRQRLKLVRQVGVLTAQSKLTAIVVSVLPFAMAALLQYLSPGYLNPLFESELGKFLLTGALILMILGAFLMRKMATVKV